MRGLLPASLLLPLFACSGVIGVTLRCDSVGVARIAGHDLST
jgi:hypothetical protein